MILVLSQKDEKSTDEVLIEMRYLGIDFIRINEDDKFFNIELHFINKSFDLSFSIHNRRVFLSEITGFWYRRGRFNFRFNESLLDTLMIDDFILYRQYFDQEFEHITALLNEHLKQIPHINSFDDNFISKMAQLYWAVKLGLNIPDTSILNNKSSLMKFFNDSKNGIILKNIRTNSFKKYFESSTRYYITNHIIPVTKDNIKQSSDSFLPTKFQKYTDKKFEIRSFFLKDLCVIQKLLIMRLKLIIIILLTFKTGYASSNYCMLINEAEQNIVKLDYNSALKKYYEANRVTDMFSIDINNALVCAILTNDEKAIKHFGNLLAQKGLPQSYFLNKTTFNKLNNSNYWIEIAEKSQKNWNKKLIENQSLRQTIDSILKVDSTLNTFRVTKNIENDTSWIKENDIKFENRIKDNALYLLSVFEIYGFPGDDHPYFYMPNDTTISYIPTFSEPIIHSYQGKRHGYFKTDTFFTPILTKSWENDKISSLTISYLQDMGNLNMEFRRFYGTSHIFIKEDNEFYASPYYYGDIEIRNKINFNRAQIGLIPLEEEIKKMKFYESVGKNLGFIFFVSFNTYSGYSIKDSYIKI